MINMKSNMTTILDRYTCRVFILCFAFSFSAISCHKIKKFDKAKMLLDKQWRLISVQKSGEEIIEDCQLDNSIRFTRFKEVIYNEGSNECEQTVFFANRWKFDGDYKRVKFKYVTRGRLFNGLAKVSNPWEIVSLSDTILKIITLPGKNGFNPNLVKTYRH